MLRELHGPRRLRFTDAHRRRLARAANKLIRKTLLEIEALVTPDTLLRWYKRLGAAKYDGSAKGPLHICGGRHAIVRATWVGILHPLLTGSGCPGWITFERCAGSVSSAESRGVRVPIGGRIPFWRLCEIQGSHGHYRWPGVDRRHLHGYALGIHIVRLSLLASTTRSLGPWSVQRLRAAPVGALVLALGCGSKVIVERGPQSVGECGDGVVNGTEACDGADLGGASCSTLGFSTGELACAAHCQFDASACEAPEWGRIDVGKEEVCTSSFCSLSGGGVYPYFADPAQVPTPEEVVGGCRRYSGGLDFCRWWTIDAGPVVVSGTDPSPITSVPDSLGSCGVGYDCCSCTFVPGATIGFSLEGNDVVPAMSAAVTAPPPPDVTVVPQTGDPPVTVRWEPVGDFRVVAELIADAYEDQVICEAPDQAGEITFPQALVEDLAPYTGMWISVNRVSRTRAASEGKTVRLEVSSARAYSIY